MDRRIFGPPDPVTGPLHGERRRRVRQKLNTPVYASFNAPQTGMVVDLSELLDLNEEGFAVRTSERLEANRAVTLCLDLPETRNHIHGNGQVIWSDDTGRGGIRFSGLQESSRQILKDWLFTNLLIASSNHAARTGQLALHEEQKSPELVLVGGTRSAAPVSDTSETPSLVETVRREVREIGDDVDAVFRCITERVLGLTGASGAALAFRTDDRMICRARAGEPAPPLRSPVDVKQGLSGECVRTGLIVSCEDTENDARVDPELCRALGIGSLMAAPIVSDFKVVGLLEVFSSQARAFTRAHETLLDQLVEMIPKTHGGKTPPDKTPPQTPSGYEAVSAASQPPTSAVDSIQALRDALLKQRAEIPEQFSITGENASEPVPEQVPEPAAPRLLYRSLLGLAIAVVAMVLGYVVGPLLEKRFADSPQASQPTPVKANEAALRVAGQRSADPQAQAESLADLRKLADQGDADAQWQMGVRYHNGEDVPQDDMQAMQWFQRAGEQGNVAAQSALGAYYWAGRGVPEDLSKAYFWSAIALAHGDENSKVRLEGLASQMTRTQVSEARQQAEVWIRAHGQRAKAEPN